MPVSTMLFNMEKQVTPLNFAKSRRLGWTGLFCLNRIAFYAIALEKH